MRHIITIIKKQIKETTKNTSVLIQFVMFPLLTIIMTKSVRMEGMPENFFVNLFAIMYIGMAPLTCMSAILSEEKEKNTLRVLIMADVSPVQYLLGIGSYIFTICLAGSILFCCLLENVTGQDRAVFLLLLAVGIVTSLVIGAAIGIGSRDQMQATSITVPVMLIFSFLPMLSMFNKTFEKIAQITYSEQIRIIISDPEKGKNCLQNIYIILLNIFLAGIVFLILYKKQGTGLKSLLPPEHP